VARAGEDRWDVESEMVRRPAPFGPKRGDPPATSWAMRRADLVRSLAGEPVIPEAAGVWIGVCADRFCEPGWLLIALGRGSQRAVCGAAG
jgi:hypothetical protein